MDATKAMNSIKKVLTAYPSHCCGRKRPVSFALLPLLFLLCLVLSSKASGQGFRAAVVKVDITPEDSQNLLGYQARKSTGVHDHIFHRIVVLDDGNTQFFLVSSDLCEISPSAIAMGGWGICRQLQPGSMKDMKPPFLPIRLRQPGI